MCIENIKFYINCDVSSINEDVVEICVSGNVMGADYSEIVGISMTEPHDDFSFTLKLMDSFNNALLSNYDNDSLYNDDGTRSLFYISLSEDFLPMVEKYFKKFIIDYCYDKFIDDINNMPV